MPMKLGVGDVVELKNRIPAAAKPLRSPASHGFPHPLQWLRPRGLDPTRQAGKIHSPRLESTENDDDNKMP